MFSLKFLKGFFLSRGAFWVSLFLVVLVPFHALLGMGLLYGVGLDEVGGLGFLIRGWKEVLIVILFGLSLLRWRGFVRLHYLILGFLVFGVLVTVMNVGFDLSVLLWGGRTEFSFLLLLFGWSILFRGFSFEERRGLLKGFLWSAVGVLGFGLVLLVTGHEWLVVLGYAPEFSSFGADRAVAFCQMEGGTDFCRLQSSLSGPNRYGGFLVLVLVFLMVLGRDFLKNVWLRGGLFLVVLVSLGATLSLSAWISVVLVFLGWLVYLRRSLFWPVVVFFLVVSGVLAGRVLLDYDEFFASLSASNQGHLEYGVNALRLFWERPFGYGLGFMGPASYKLGQGMVSENWFLQVLVNLGVLGFVMFVGILFEVMRRLWLRGGVGVLGFLAMVGVFAQNLFLHTLEDSAVYVGLVLLVCFGFFAESWRVVVPKEGKGIGRVLGFPTVNFVVDGEVDEDFGVYAAKVRVDGLDVYAAAVNFGGRPTFDDDERLMEAFILNFDDKFAKALNEGYLFEVSLMRRVREVKKFEDVEALKGQIAEDVKIIKKILKC